MRRLARANSQLPFFLNTVLPLPAVLPLTRSALRTNPLLRPFPTRVPLTFLTLLHLARDDTSTISEAILLAPTALLRTPGLASPSFSPPAGTLLALVSYPL